MYYVSTLFFVISLGLSKISVAFLLLHLTPQKEHTRILHVIVGLIAVWTVASTFAVALQCNLSHPWILIQETCPGTVIAYASPPFEELKADAYAVPAMAGHFGFRHRL
jgi:Fungal rhodopsin domain